MLHISIGTKCVFYRESHAIAIISAHPNGGRGNRVRSSSSCSSTSGLVGDLSAVHSTLLSLFVVAVFCWTYVCRWQRRARLPKNLQHFEMCEEIRHGRIKVQTSLQRRTQSSQQIDERFLLAPDPRPSFVLHLVRCDVHVNLNGKSRQRFEETARCDPCVLGAAVSSVQPVHFLDARQQPDHGEVVGR